MLHFYRGLAFPTLRKSVVGVLAGLLFAISVTAAESTNPSCHNAATLMPVQPAPRVSTFTPGRHVMPGTARQECATKSPLADIQRSKTDHHLQLPNGTSPSKFQVPNGRLQPIDRRPSNYGLGNKSVNHDFIERTKNDRAKLTPLIPEGPKCELPATQPPSVGVGRNWHELPVPNDIETRRNIERENAKPQPDKRELERSLEIKKVIAIDKERNARCESPIFRGGYYVYTSYGYHKPLRYGYWVFHVYDSQSCRRSVYFYYGYFPYIQVTRVYVLPYVVVSYVSTPVKICDEYYLARREDALLRNALADIRDAWLYGKSYLIATHVRAGSRIAVFLDNHYEYSIDADDYADMTADAISEITTFGFTWQTLKKRVDGSYTAFARHVYRDKNGETKTIYVSYTLRLIDDDFYIIEVGASKAPLG
jgi:hypothetical protein